MAGARSEESHHQRANGDSAWAVQHGYLGEQGNDRLFPEAFASVRMLSIECLCNFNFNYRAPVARCGGWRPGGRRRFRGREGRGLRGGRGVAEEGGDVGFKGRLVPDLDGGGGFRLVEPAPLPPFTQQPAKLLRRDQRLLTDELLANRVPPIQRMPVAHRRDALQHHGQLVGLWQHATALRGPQFGIESLL